ncbi:CAP domain-containing protein [Nocardioides sp. KC13]|uniref:CAP domain-containing protein n=1 Tax=Nocardioides turkmenicus TaxID=2711220 RepID=A0A6M1R7M2_9ACTN|nr:CAP domain-containing protein [Nocardioides sp. KC13]NGN93639.1 CAP domain-containing protein [Nocardioides sp. KC13]
MFPHMHRLASCVLALLLAAAALLVGAAPASAGEGGAIKRLANAARAEAGLDPLTRDSDLDELARTWAYKIAADGELSHNPDLAEQVPEGWQGVGENVAMGYPTGAEMHRGWMNSDGHRANILGDYTHIGIAFVVGDGTSWGVQVFAKYPPGVRPTAEPKAEAPAPTAPASTRAPTPRQTPKPEKSATASPTPSRTPSASASPSKAPSAPPSASPSESTSALAGDSETAGPVTFTDASDSPSPASSGLFGIGYVEMAVAILALSGLGLLIAFLLARRRRREQHRRDLEAYPARHVRPAGPYPGGGPVHRGQVHPARPHPGPHPGPGRPRPFPGDGRPW